MCLKSIFWVKENGLVTAAQFSMDHGISSRTIFVNWLKGWFNY